MEQTWAGNDVYFKLGGVVYTAEYELIYDQAEILAVELQSLHAGNLRVATAPDCMQDKLALQLADRACWADAQLKFARLVPKC